MDELIAAGEPPEVIEAARQREARNPADHICRVLPSNWDALQLFLALQTQWDRAGITGARTGLKYDRIPVVLAGRPDISQPLEKLFTRLQLLELYALNELSQREQRS